MVGLYNFGLFLTISILSAAGTEMEMLCNPNELPCKSDSILYYSIPKTCYDPATEICHKIGEGAIKCKKTENVCFGEYSHSGECYNSSTHACIQNKQDYFAMVCLKAEKLCYKTCFYPKNQECHGQIICNNGDLLCHGICYNPKEQQCSQKKLCKITEKACNGECYPSDTIGSCFTIEYSERYGGISNYKSIW